MLVSSAQAQKAICVLLAVGLIWTAALYLCSLARAEEQLTLTSSAFSNGSTIPVKYAHLGVPGGKNMSIPISWKNVPPGAQSLAIAMIDRHPIAKNWIHWLVINIPVTISGIEECASGTGKMPAGAEELYNSFGAPGYGGPQPPPGSGVHQYEITLYALRSPKLHLGPRSSLAAFEKALQEEVLASAEITGEYAR